jgi:hypothetical protein
MLFHKQLFDRGNDFCVINGVFDAITVGGMFAAQADFKIQLHGLRHLLFLRIDADAGFDAQFADEYGVHVRQVCKRRCKKRY